MDARQKSPKLSPGAAQMFGLLVLSTLPFGLYAYNSGYGYDQLEYLIIGRSLVDGFSFYDLVPSKSPGMYLLVALLLNCGLTLGHAQLAVLIAAVYLLIVVATFVVACRIWDRGTACVATALVAACVWFMELNFLQPTSFVYLLGLLAYAHCVHAEQGFAPERHWFWCGALIAFGMQWKSVAAFYGMAALFLVLIERRRSGAIRNGLALTFGALVPTVLVVAYFWSTGRLAEFWLWTVYFPLFKYPSNTAYLSKLYTKLLCFVLVFAGTVACSLLPRYRREVWGDFPTRSAFAFGVFSLLALTKTQASHYYFPAAAFLSLFSARVVTRVAQAAVGPKRRLLLLTAAGGAVALAVVSAALYRPQVLLRLATARSFEDEAQLRQYVQGHSTPKQRILAFSGSTFVYWVSHRYPPWPLVNTDVQSTFYVQQHSDALLNSLRDPALSLVEFDPGHPAFEDPNFDKTSGERLQLARFKATLERDFVRDPGGPAGRVFWIRTASAAPR